MVPEWVTFLITFLGGGIGVKVLDVVAFRDRDSSRMRQELWAEMGALREICTRQDKKIEELESLIRTLREDRHAYREVANVFKLRVVELMLLANDELLREGRPPRYDLVAEEAKMVKELERGNG